jgi:hypothetical protein
MPVKRNPLLMRPSEWYGLQVWRETARRQLQIEPECRVCASAGKHVKAGACDHINGFKTFNEFLLGPFMSLCRSCSDRKQRGHDIYWTGVDGEKIDVGKLPPPKLTLEC